MALLTVAQQQAIKPISPNWAIAIKMTGGVNNFTQLQAEVEEKELKQLLSPAFLYDIQQNLTEEKYITLLDGSEFTTESGNKLYFSGLRYILAYFNWSKYVAESHFADTFGGMVQKNRAESTALSSGDIKRTQTDAREIALQDFEIMKIYLDENTDIYPLWESCKKKRKLFTTRITGIKRTIM